MDEQQRKVLDQAFEKKSFAGEFMKNHLLDVAVLVVMLVYVARTIAAIGVADKSVLEILADGALAFVFSIFIALLMKKKGLLVGGEEPIYKATMQAYGEAINCITPYVDGLDAFCDERNEKNRERAVKDVLRGYGISYERYLKGFEQPTEEEKAALSAVNAVRVHQWTTRELVCENMTSVKKEQYSFGMTQREYERKKNALNVVMTLLTAGIFGYFTLRIIDSFNLAALVWACMQVAFFVVKGALAFADAFMFKKHDERGRIIYKTNVLYEFYNEQQKKEKNENVPTQETDNAADRNERAESGKDVCGQL